MKKIFLVFSFVLSFTTIFSQAPGSDCEFAITVSANGCSPSTGTFDNTGFVGTLAPPTCFGTGTPNGMWFQFAAIGPVVNITVNGTTLTQPMVTLLSSTGVCANPFTELACSNPGTSSATISYSSLTTGSIYYIYVDGSNNGVGTFNLCLNSPSQPQNDLMCNAITLPASNFCSPDNAYTNVGATQDMLINNTVYPGCWTDGLGANNGVWFKFVALGNQCDITVSGFTTPIINVVAPPANNCNSTDFANFIFRACNQSTTGASTTASSNSFVAGQTYYILVDGYNNTTGSFKICVNSYTPSATLINDACSGSIPLCPNSTVTGTTQGGNPVNSTDPPVQWGTGATGNNCNGDNNFTVYYDFWTDANNSPVTIQIFPNCTNPGIPGSIDNNRLQVGIFGFTNNSPCDRNNWDYLVCDAKNQNYGASFTLSTTSAMTQPNTHYYIVFDSFPDLPCSFNIDITGNRGANAGQDQAVCLNAPPLNLTGFTPTSGGTWSGPGITNPNLGTFNPSIAGIGKHVVYYSFGPCMDSKIITVTAPSVNVSNNVTLCSGQCITLIGDATQPNTVVTTPTFTSTINNITITDNNTTGVSSSINVTGLSSATIKYVTINGINHLKNQDLDIYLVCPNGTQLELSTDNGGNGDNYTNVIFSDTASININSTAGVATTPITGLFLPEAGSFSALNSCLTNGQWKLLVKDDAPNTQGTLVSWSITFTNSVTTIIPASTYTWTPNPGTNANFTTSNLNTLTPQICATSTASNSSQTFTLTATDATGCVATDQVTVNVAPLIITASNDQTICAGLSVNLTANGANSYAWASSGTGDLSASTGSSVTASPTVTTTYTVTGTSGACVDTEEITVTVGSSLSPTLTADTICENDTLNLTSSIANATYYSWTGPNGFTSSLQNPVLSNASTLNSGTYTFSVTANGCPGSATINALVKPKPSLNVVASGTYCPFTYTNLIQFIGTTGATFNWSNSNSATGLDSLSGSGDITSFQTLNNTNAPITSVITATPTLNGCSGSAQTFTITVSAPGSISFTMDSLDLTCASANSGAITITPGGTNYTYNWISGPTGYSLPSTNNQASLTNLPEGEYCVEINSPARAAGNVTIFTETFENGITNWTLNNSNGTNIWVNNNSYAGGYCDPFGSVAATPNQPAAITGSPQSNYLHVIGTNTNPVTCGPASVNFPPLNACYNVSQASTQYATLNTAINTVGLSNVIISFYWLGVGEVNDYAVLESSIDGGVSWVQAGAVLNNQATWTLTTRTSATWANISNLRFRFKWTNNASSGSDPSIAIDQIVITADAPASCPAQATECATLIAPPVTRPEFTQISSICQGGTITLPTSSNNPTPVTGTWSPAVNNQLTTTYTFTPTSGQCAEDTIMEVVVKPRPTLTNPNDTSVCAGKAINAVTFNSSLTNTTIAWTNSTTGIGLIASGTGNINSFIGANNGNSPLTATITATPTANGCTGTPVDLLITVKPKPSLTSVTSQTVCADDLTLPVNFVPSTFDSVSWTNTQTGIGLGSEGLNSISAFSATNNTTSPLIGAFSATPFLNSCVGNPITFSITVNPVPVLNDIPDTSVCAGQTINSINFSASLTNTSISWTNNTTGIGLGANGTGNINSFTGTNSGTTPISGTITATPTAFGCTGDAQTFSVTVNPNPTDIIAPATNENCGQSDGTLNITNTTGGTAPFQYSINGGTYIRPPLSFTNLSAGNYTIAVLDTNGCSFSKTVSISNVPGPVAEFTASQLSGFDSINVVFSNQSSSGANINYYWDFGNGNLDTTSSLSESPSQSYYGVNSYTVTLLVANGNPLCNDTAKVFIYVDITPFIEIPNVFSPNGDNVNEFFNVNYRGYKNLNMIIFNRWGNKLFETSSPGIGWDGTGASEGTYFYIVTGVGSDNKNFEAKGYLTLVR